MVNILFAADSNEYLVSFVRRNLNAGTVYRPTRVRKLDGIEEAIRRTVIRRVAEKTTVAGPRQSEDVRGNDRIDVVDANGAQWPSGLERWTGDRVVLGSNHAAVTSLRNFGNSVYPALPVSFGGDTKSRHSLLPGVFARGSKISHQSALEMCNPRLSWTLA